MRQQASQIIGHIPLVLEFFFQFNASQSGQLPQTDFKNVFGLNFCQSKVLDEVDFGIIGLPNNPDNGINIQKNPESSFENMDTRQSLVQTKLATAANGAQTISYPLPQNGR